MRTRYVCVLSSSIPFLNRSSLKCSKCKRRGRAIFRNTFNIYGGYVSNVKKLCRQKKTRRIVSVFRKTSSFRDIRCFFILFSARRRKHDLFTHVSVYELYFLFFFLNSKTTHSPIRFTFNRYIIKQ